SLLLLSLSLSLSLSASLFGGSVVSRIPFFLLFMANLPSKGAQPFAVCSCLALSVQCTPVFGVQRPVQPASSQQPQQSGGFFGLQSPIASNSDSVRPFRKCLPRQRGDGTSDGQEKDGARRRPITSFTDQILRLYHYSLYSLLPLCSPSCVHLSTRRRLAGSFLRTEGYQVSLGAPMKSSSSEKGVSTTYSKAVRPGPERRHVLLKLKPMANAFTPSILRPPAQLLLLVASRSFEAPHFNFFTGGSWAAASANRYTQVTLKLPEIKLNRDPRAAPHAKPPRRPSEGRHPTQHEAEVRTRSITHTAGYGRESQGCFPCVVDSEPVRGVPSVVEVGCERFFNLAGYISSPRRTNLGVRTYERLAMLSCLLRKVYVDEEWVAQEYLRRCKAGAWKSEQDEESLKCWNLERIIESELIGAPVPVDLTMEEFVEVDASIQPNFYFSWLLQTSNSPTSTPEVGFFLSLLPGLAGYSLKGGRSARIWVGKKRECCTNRTDRTTEDLTKRRRKAWDLGPWNRVASGPESSSTESSDLAMGDVVSRVRSSEARWVWRVAFCLSHAPITSVVRFAASLEPALSLRCVARDLEDRSKMGTLQSRQKFRIAKFRRVTVVRDGSRLFYGDTGLGGGLPAAVLSNNGRSGLARAWWRGSSRLGIAGESQSRFIHAASPEIYTYTLLKFCLPSSGLLCLMMTQGLEVDHPPRRAHPAGADERNPQGLQDGRGRGSCWTSSKVGAEGSSSEGPLIPVRLVTVPLWRAMSFADKTKIFGAPTAFETSQRQAMMPMRSTERPTGKFSTMIFNTLGTTVPPGAQVSETVGMSRADKVGKISQPLKNNKTKPSNIPQLYWCMYLIEGNEAQASIAEEKVDGGWAETEQGKMKEVLEGLESTSDSGIITSFDASAAISVAGQYAMSYWLSSWFHFPLLHGAQLSKGKPFFARQPRISCSSCPLLLLASVLTPVFSAPAPRESGGLRAAASWDIQNAGNATAEEGTVQILKTDFDRLMEKVDSIDSILSGNKPDHSRRLSSSCPSADLKTESQLRGDHDGSVSLVEGRPYKRHCAEVSDGIFSASKVYSVVKPYWHGEFEGKLRNQCCMGPWSCQMLCAQDFIYDVRHWKVVDKDVTSEQLTKYYYDKEGTDEYVTCDVKGSATHVSHGNTGNRGYQTIGRPQKWNKMEVFLDRYKPAGDSCDSNPYFDQEMSNICSSWFFRPSVYLPNGYPVPNIKLYKCDNINDFDDNAPDAFEVWLRPENSVDCAAINTFGVEEKLTTEASCGWLEWSSAPKLVQFKAYPTPTGTGEALSFTVVLRPLEAVKYVRNNKRGLDVCLHDSSVGSSNAITKDMCLMCVRHWKVVDKDVTSEQLTKYYYDKEGTDEYVTCDVKGSATHVSHGNTGNRGYQTIGRPQKWNKMEVFLDRYKPAGDSCDSNPYFDQEMSNICSSWFFRPSVYLPNGYPVPNIKLYKCDNINDFDDNAPDAFEVWLRPENSVDCAAINTFGVEEKLTTEASCGWLEWSSAPKLVQFKAYPTPTGTGEALSFTVVLRPPRGCEVCS
ncbi:hypothetical protein THAOC_00936, partial [Thalassiosira oceanica]